MSLFMYIKAEGKCILMANGSRLRLANFTLARVGLPIVPALRMVKRFGSSLFLRTLYRNLSAIES